jgi:hypothetical protein
MRLRTQLLASAVALAGAVGISAEAQTAVYSAQAVNFDAPSGVATGLIQIQITRWSTDAERDALRTALNEKGPDKLLDVLSKQDEVGTIRSPESVGYPLRYARRTVTGGNEQVVIITDRPMGFWERRAGPPSSLPFTVVELQLRRTAGRRQCIDRDESAVNRFTNDIELENPQSSLAADVRREKLARSGGRSRRTLTTRVGDLIVPPGSRSCCPESRNDLKRRNREQAGGVSTTESTGRIGPPSVLTTRRLQTMPPIVVPFHARNAM